MTRRAHSLKNDAESFSRDMNFIIYPMSQNGNCSLNLRVNIKCEFFLSMSIYAPFRKIESERARESEREQEGQRERKINRGMLL